MKVRFAGEMVELHDLIARCLAANYNGFGFDDRGEADIIAERLLSVLDRLGVKWSYEPPSSNTVPKVGG